MADASKRCTACSKAFNLIKRPQRCRVCNMPFCKACFTDAKGVCNVCTKASNTAKELGPALDTSQLSAVEQEALKRMQKAHKDWDATLKASDGEFLDEMSVHEMLDAVLGTETGHDVVFRFVFLLYFPTLFKHVSARPVEYLLTRLATAYKSASTTEGTEGLRVQNAVATLLAEWFTYFPRDYLLLQGTAPLLELQEQWVYAVAPKNKLTARGDKKGTIFRTVSRIMVHSSERTHTPLPDLSVRVLAPWETVLSAETKRTESPTNDSQHLPPGVAASPARHEQLSEQEQRQRLRASLQLELLRVSKAASAAIQTNKIKAVNAENHLSSILSDGPSQSPDFPTSSVTDPASLPAASLPSSSSSTASSSSSGSSSSSSSSASSSASSSGKDGSTRSSQDTLTQGRESNGLSIATTNLSLRTYSSLSNSYSPGNRSSGLFADEDVDWTNGDPSTSALRKICTFKAYRIADQLTVQDWRLFAALEPREFLGKSWTRKGTAHTTSPNIMALVELFNARSFWAASIVLVTSDPGERVHTLKKMVNVAYRCLTSQNYFSAHAIFTGLRLSPVGRLASTWEKIPQRSKKHWLHLKEELGEPNAYRALFRQGLKIGRPQIPHLAVVLRDLFQIEELATLKPEDSEALPEERAVNLHKFMAHFRVLAATILACQRRAGEAEVSAVLDGHAIASTLQSGYKLALTEDALWDASYLLEPKSSAHALQLEWSKAGPEERLRIETELLEDLRIASMPVLAARRERDLAEQKKREEEDKVRSLRAQHEATIRSQEDEILQDFTEKLELVALCKQKETRAAEKDARRQAEEQEREREKASEEKRDKSKSNNKPKKTTAKNNKTKKARTERGVKKDIRKRSLVSKPAASSRKDKREKGSGLREKGSAAGKHETKMCLREEGGKNVQDAAKHTEDTHKAQTARGKGEKGNKGGKQQSTIDRLASPKVRSAKDKKK